MKYDTIVIGAGSMGMAAGYYLAKEENKVLLIDSYDPPHNHGSHHGETRIIRHAYGEGESYVPLALRAQELWQELEQEAEMSLFLQTGVINVGAANSTFIKEVQESAKKHLLPIHTLSSEEIRNKWPGMKFPDHYVGCLETSSGVLFSERCILAYRKLAEGLGAHLQANTEVVDILLEGEEVLVKTTHSDYVADKVIVTAGAWTGKLLEAIQLKAPLSPTRKTFSWFDTDNNNYNQENFPAFTINHEDGMYYGFPNIEGAGLKIGRHDGGQKLLMNESLAEFGTYPDDEADVTAIVKEHFPHVGSFKQGKTCIYTNTPDGDFIIDKHPNHSNVVIACGFSGHGFKFSSVVGEILKQMALNQEIDFDLSPFSLHRF